MATAQIQLDVAAHNIANANKPGFSRQRAMLATQTPNYFPYGQVGRGVAVDDIERVRDEFLDQVYRAQVPGLGSAEVLAGYYALIEDTFLEPSEDGFGTRMNAFFDAMNDFANNVEEYPVREALITEAQSMAASFNQLAERIDLLRTQANEEVRNAVPQINSLLERIASLNDKISAAEVSGHQANDLRDDRGVLIDELAQLMDIDYRERVNGQIDVFVGGMSLVEGEVWHEVEAVRNPALDAERDDLVELRFVENGRALRINGGEVYGALTARDSALVSVEDRIDTLAATIIQQVNLIHSQGNGLENLSGTISSTNQVSAAGDPLVSAGLPFPVTPGTFDLVVYDAAGNPTTASITITNATTLSDLAASLNTIPGFSASVVDGTLQMGATPPASFTFANDTSGVLTALGVNGLFTGSDAGSMGVSQDIIDNPGWLTSGYSLDVLETGDNSAALAMAEVRNGDFLEGGAATINDYYEGTIAQVGVDAQANLQALEVERSFVNDFEARRQEVSGVSLDEEVTNLLMFQRAFEASARVITVADTMLNSLIGILG
jgi:flagellar hook-associated protein 1 FlgK